MVNMMRQTCTNWSKLYIKIIDLVETGLYCNSVDVYVICNVYRTQLVSGGKMMFRNRNIKTIHIVALESL